MDRGLLSQAVKLNHLIVSLILFSLFSLAFSMLIPVCILFISVQPNNLVTGLLPDLWEGSHPL